MDNNITIINQLGEIEEVEVLDIFEVEGYEGKKYILYTNNKEVDEEHIETFVSILEEKEDHFEFKLIENPEELETVTQAVLQLGEDANE